MGTITFTFGFENMPDDTKDRLIAPKISLLSNPTIEDISEQRKYPLNTFIFNFQTSLMMKNKYRQLVFNLIRKSCDALDEYSEGYKNLSAFIGNPQISIPEYFKAIRHFEHCVSHTYQAVICLNSMNKSVNGPLQYDRGDGSILERISLIHADIKHMDNRFETGNFANLPTLQAISNIKKDQNAPDDASIGNIPMWMTNEGLESLTAKVSYKELATELLDIHQQARELAKMQLTRSTAATSK